MSSFRKRHVHKPVPGTRTSPQTGQVITSSGNPSLDVIVGGGLPVGSICLIEEDKYVTYSKVLAKYFVAEGVVSCQSILLGSLDDDTKDILRKLPQPLNEFEVEEEIAVEEKIEDAHKNGLRIAWRYNDLPPVNSEQSPSKIGHHFNLMKYMDVHFMDFVEIILWNTQKFLSSCKNTQNYKIDQNATSSSSESNISCKEGVVDHAAPTEKLPSPTDTTSTTQSANVSQVSAQETSTTSSLDDSKKSSFGKQNDNVQKIFENQKYQHLLNLIQSVAREERFTPGAMSYRSLLRICITSLGSPLWYDEDFSKHILKFLTILRGIVRNSVSVCFISMPMYLISKFDETLVPKIRNLVDYAIELESFAGSERETNPIYKDYNGLLHLHKITAVNTLTAYVPETSDLAFKLRRKKFVIEKLHLPPELKESDTESKPTLSCSASAASTAASMDF